MKKIVCALLLLIICFSATSCGEASIEVPNGMKLASEEQDPYYLFIPSGWAYDRGYNMPYAYHSASDTSNVMVMLYQAPVDANDSNSDTEEKVSETLDPTVETNVREPYIRDFWSKFQKDAVDLYGTSYELLEETASALGGYYAIQYTYSEKIGTETYKHISVVTFLGSSNLFVCFTYTAKESNFDKHLSDVNTMIKEFKFK